MGKLRINVNEEPMISPETPPSTLLGGVLVMLKLRRRHNEGDLMNDSGRLKKACRVIDSI